MPRARPRTEGLSRPTALRGSVGSARVWDASTRAQHASRDSVATPASLTALAPDELAALVRGIVQVTLDTQLPECEGERRAALARELEARLLAAFGAAVSGRGTPRFPESNAGASPDTAFAPRATAETARTAEQELAAEGSGAAEPSAPAEPAATAESDPLRDASPVVRTLGLVLEDRLCRLGGHLAERSDLRQRLIALAVHALENAAQVPAASGAELRALDVLQRRAGKLERALQETRSSLAYVSGLEHVDPGLASIYRTVQGLALDDPQRTRKHGALELIFRSNLELQKLRA